MAGRCCLVPPAGCPVSRCVAPEQGGRLGRWLAEVHAGRATADGLCGERQPPAVDVAVLGTPWGEERRHSRQFSQFDFDSSATFDLPLSGAPRLSASSPYPRELFPQTQRSAAQRNAFDFSPSEVTRSAPSHGPKTTCDAGRPPLPRGRGVAGRRGYCRVASGCCHLGVDAVGAQVRTYREVRSA